MPDHALQRTLRLRVCFAAERVSRRTPDPDGMAWDF